MDNEKKTPDPELNRVKRQIVFLRYLSFVLTVFIIILLFQCMLTSARIDRIWETIQISIRFNELTIETIKKIYEFLIFSN